MSLERDLLGRWHNGDLLPEEYMKLMKETKELLAQPEEEPSVKLPESEDEEENYVEMLPSELWFDGYETGKRSALLSKQPEQEPVATKLESHQFNAFHVSADDFKKLQKLPTGTKIYTAPPKREPLSEDEIVALWANKSPANEFECVRLVEKAHGIGGE